MELAEKLYGSGDKGVYEIALAAELTRRLSYGILFQKGKQNQPLPALRQ